MKLESKAVLGLMMAGLVSLAAVATAMAQDTSKTQVRTGTPTSTTTVEKGEVIYVSGNDLVVKMDTGEIRHMNVPILPGRLWMAKTFLSTTSNRE